MMKLSHTVGMQRSASQRKAKKVCMPTVPNVSMPSSESAGAYCKNNNGNHYDTLKPKSNFSQWITGYEQENNLANSVSPIKTSSSSMTTSSSELSRHSSPCDQSNANSTETCVVHFHQPYAKHVISGHSQNSVGQFANTNSTVCPNVIVNSPLRHRNSTGSTSSHSSSGFESMKSGSQVHSHLTANSVLRGDSPPSRNSIHSSSGSSSLGSLERLDESTTCSTSHVNLAEMISNGLPDQEIITAWLHNLHYEDYVPLFLGAGYDLATIARMTPEDLTAIGITKPGHRKRLTTEIHKMNVFDHWADTKPADITSWLKQLQLLEYVQLFLNQDYTTMDQVLQLTWEDFEDVGVKKLGHLKKLTCAIKKIKDGRTAAARQQRQAEVGSVDSLGSASSTTASANGAEVALIAVANQRALEPRRSSQSPYALITFQQRSLSQSQDISAYASCHSTPNRQNSASSINNVGQHVLAPTDEDDTASAVFDTTTTPGPSPYGDVSRRLGVVTRRFPSCDGSLQQQQQPAHGDGAFCSLSCDNLMNKPSSLLGDTMTCGRRKSVQHPNAAYSYVSVGATTIAGTSTSQKPSPGLPQPSSAYRCWSNGSLPPLPTCSTPPRKAQPPVASSCKPHIFQLSAQPLLAAADDTTSTAEDGDVSPAPSIEEFPPPPDPITCEQSIKHLRDLRRSTTNSGGLEAGLGSPNISGAALHCNGLQSSTIGRRRSNGAEIYENSQSATIQRRKMSQSVVTTGAGHDLSASGAKTPTADRSPAITPRPFGSSVGVELRHNSTASIDSNSSSETLPFANENVGTIRQKAVAAAVVCSRTGLEKTLSPSPHRPLLSNVFPTVDGFKFSEPSRIVKQTNVLNDIGFMLQDLTDQLDAMLCEPENLSSQSQKVN